MDITKEKICIILVTYNPLQWIERCLDCIFNLNSSANLKVLLIDNDSTDGFQYILSDRLQQNNVKFVQLNSNIGFGQANNIGLKYALEHEFDFAFLLNQDVYVQKNTIETLVKISKQKKEYGILSPLHLNGDGTRLDFYFSTFIGEKYCPFLISDFMIGKIKKDVYPLDFVNAAAWLLPLKTLQDIGGFDPIFFHYGEDDNYCQRVRYHELKLGIVPDSIIFHDRNQNFSFDDRYENLTFFERSIKVKLGDLNIPFNHFCFWEFKELKRRIFVSLFAFNYKGFFKWLKFYFLLVTIIPGIKKSRELNKIKGSTYLN